MWFQVPHRWYKGTKHPEASQGQDIPEKKELSRSTREGQGGAVLSQASASGTQEAWCSVPSGRALSSHIAYWFAGRLGFQAHRKSLDESLCSRSKAPWALTSPPIRPVVAGGQGDCG